MATFSFVLSAEEVRGYVFLRTWPMGAKDGVSRCAHFLCGSSTSHVWSRWSVMSRLLAKSIGLSLLPTRSTRKCRRRWRIIHQVVCAAAARLVARLGPQMSEPSECWIESSSPKLPSRAKPSPLCESWCAARRGFAPPCRYVPKFVNCRDASVLVRSTSLPLPKHLLVFS